MDAIVKLRNTILVVDDEPDLIDLVRYHLLRSGFEVLLAVDGSTALKVAGDTIPDAIILDIMLPIMSGIEVFKALRQKEETALIPILMLTAKDAYADRVAGLELGADDYVTKPFSPRELILRVQNLLRHAGPPHAAAIVTVNDFKLDKGNFEISVAGSRLDLTTTEFKLLATFIERRGKVLSRETLLKDVWGYKNAVDTRTVDTHVRRLREKLGTSSGRIVTIRGEGYRFLALHTA